ncbi:alanine/glycine:cation symporter family protein [Aureispira anguillae]|uniref:Alanine:cation symporter family protein n=1 Tax=Aureispira anguillae TaxID=2864201 RepID=A0A916DUU8_9BACT|nr:alanine/glycine:cation symporter family protein [Aureispira anguillae]BDS13686.1 alanine:cation symporter family protein [Aureispira anguillae]
MKPRIQTIQQRLFFLLFALLSPILAFCQDPAAKGIDQKIDEAFKPIADAIFNFVLYSIPLGGGLSAPIVLIVLISGALYFTFYFAFPNIRYLGLAIKTVKGDFYEPTSTSNITPSDHQRATVLDDMPDTIRDESAQGEVTPFQALTAALSATVGLGNIAGVAVALSVGGPGATFWMILAGILGMATKFTECTLGVKYREIDADGTVHGGPMYYLSKGLDSKGLGGLGKVFAVFFAIMCVGGSFGGGNMFQANQAAAQFLSMVYGNDIPLAAKTIFGVIIAILVAVVIIGGIKRIGQVTEKIVPFMAVLYVGAAIVIIIMNIAAIPAAVGLIFSGAFTPTAAVGGFIGVLIQGFQRAAFSNEAGVGSAAIAHSAVRTAHPASEGMVALLEPFIDTVVICTMTALVLIVTNIDGGFMTYGSQVPDGVVVTSTAFESTIPGASYILTIAVVLFAFSTMLSWSYYGLQAWKYLFGKGKTTDLVYKVLFCVFVVIGSAAGLGSVVHFSDAMIFAMVFPNIIGLLILAPVVKEEVAKYVAFTKNYKK